MAREYFKAYHSYIEAMEQLNDAEKGRLFMSCLLYSKTGEAPHLGGNERFVFPGMKSQIDRDKESYANVCRQNRENGAKGVSGRKRPAANGSDRPPKAPQGEGKGEGKGKGEEGYSSEPVSGSKPPVVLLPLNDGTEYPVTEEQCHEWAGLYPAVDVIQQLRGMRGWLLSNKTKRKTSRGIERFITSWLAKEQDRGGSRFQSGGKQQNGGDPFAGIEF